MRTKRPTLAITLLTSVVLYANAQPQWSAPLPKVGHDGYHAIVLSPEAVGRSREGLKDLRLIDSAGREVPYLIELERAVYDSAWMRSFDLIRNERVGTRTVVEMSADTNSTVDELHVRVRNARVRKSARITGSDDRSTWYMIQDQSLAIGEDGGTTSVLRFIDLPLSDYRYYRIELDDSVSAPVQVLDLGHFGRTRREGRYTEVDGLSFTRIEKGNQTHLGLSARAPFAADRVVLTIGNDGPYLREGSFYRNVWITRMGRRREVRVLTVDFQGQFKLASYMRGALYAPGIATDTLWLSIENRNDQPLRITGVKAYQLERRLIARLKAGAQYTLTTDDAKAERPDYDITHFRDSLPAPLDTLTVPAFIALATAPEEGPAFAPGAQWLWGVLIALGAIIAFSAVRLLRRTTGTN